MGVWFFFTQLKPGIELLETSSFSAAISQVSLSRMMSFVKTVCTGSAVGVRSESPSHDVIAWRIVLVIFVFASDTDWICVGRVPLLSCPAVTSSLLLFSCSVLSCSPAWSNLRVGALSFLA